MTKTAKKEANFTYQALALMSRLFYEKFGEEALPIIRDVWYRMGLASGELFKKKMINFDFKSAATHINERNKQIGEMETCLISEDLYHIATPCGFCCDVGLENAGRPICEAVMSINKGQFKSICGFDVEMNILQSKATGSDRCEIMYCPIGLSKEKKESAQTRRREEK
jgi:predicted hydrocarbon binding protein